MIREARMVQVIAHERRRPDRRPAVFYTLHDRLYDEVEFLESLRLQDELAEAIEAELEKL